MEVIAEQCHLRRIPHSELLAKASCVREILLMSFWKGQECPRRNFQVVGVIEETVARDSRKMLQTKEKRKPGGAGGWKGNFPGSSGIDP